VAVVLLVVACGCTKKHTPKSKSGVFLGGFVKRSYVLLPDGTVKTTYSITWPYSTATQTKQVGAIPNHADDPNSPTWHCDWVLHAIYQSGKSCGGVIYLYLSKVLVRTGLYLGCASGVPALGSANGRVGSTRQITLSSIRGQYPGTVTYFGVNNRWLSLIIPNYPNYLLYSRLRAIVWTFWLFS
jgi:hypothetical protein